MKKKTAIRFSKTIMMGVLALFLSRYTFSQENDESARNVFKGTRFVNSQSVNLASKGELYLFVQHRFGDVKGGFYELFGLDQATMRLGFDYGLTNRFNVGIGRSTYFKTLDGFIKYRIFGQSENFPLSMVLVTGGSLPTIKEYFPESHNSLTDKFSGNIKLIVSKSLKRIGLTLSPGFFRTGFLPASSQNFSMFSLDFGGSIKISDRVSANIEHMRFFHSEIGATYPLSLGFDIDTGGHLFQIVLSNSQGMIDQSLYTATHGSFNKGNFYVGFNLVREFNRNYNY